MEPVPIHVLVGPTAVGKTDVIHRLARAHQAAILSADSMLVYRGMDIGTAKPSPEERLGLAYYGIDLVNPGASFSVADFLKEARRAWADCARNQRPLFVTGGTGLYVRCLLEGLRSEPGADPIGRADREQKVAAGRIDELQAELGRRAPELWAGFSLAERNNHRRLIRVLEKLDAGMGPFPRTWSADPGLPPEIAGLNCPRVILHDRILKRVVRMYEGGLLEEVRDLLKMGLPPAGTAWQAIGYAEAAALLRGELTRAAAIERTVIRTRQLAKRQMTWFRGQMRVRWVERTENESGTAIAERIDAVWEKIGPVRLQGLDRAGDA